jgi:hypothetical protein
MYGRLVVRAGTEKPRKITEEKKGFYVVDK